MQPWRFWLFLLHKKMREEPGKNMSSTRRMGTEQAKSRALLLDAAEQLMVAEGYAAVTSRRLAAHAGLKPQLVHYYFRTMDDLFMELFDRVATEYLARQRELLVAPGPLKALWDISFDQEKGGLTVEFMALANHRKSLSSAIAAFGEESRKIQTKIVARVLKEGGVDTKQWSPVALAFVLECVPRSLVWEANLGQSGGHKEVLALAGRFFEQLGKK
jgi:AcrR family transcriptional regulator